MELVDALVAVKQGRSMALLGAAFSLGATSLAGIPVPGGTQLTERILADLGSTENVDYGLAAELYRKRHAADPAALATFLKRQFEVGTITPHQTQFAAFPWRSLYTTNFDNVIEVASQAAGHPRRGITTVRGPQEQDRGLPWVVHLHGFVGELAGPSFIQPFVLSRTSYLDFDFPRTAWPTRFQTDAAAAGSIFVIGYGLADLHIAKLFRSAAHLKRKTFVVVEPRASEALVSYAEEFGTVLQVGFGGFIEELERIDVPPSKPDDLRPLLAFNRVTLPDSPAPPAPDDVHQLLLSGRFNPAAYLNSVIDPARPYTFERNVALRRLEHWDGRARKFLVHSRIGNGKTIFLQQCAIRLAQHEYEVYEGIHLLESFYEELTRIRRGKGPFAFVYDGVREFEEQIKAVSQTLEARDVLIVATRPTAFATDFQNLRNVLGEGFERIDLDALPNADVIQVDGLLEFYGLWGAIGGRTQGSRLSFIRDDCGGETRSIVLHVYRDSAISGRIKEPVSRLAAEPKQFVLTFAAILAARLSDALVDFYDLCELMGVDSGETQEVFARSGVTDFFPEDGERFRARSAVLAEHVLANLIPPATCSNALSLLVERLVDFREADERYEESIPKILRYAVITRIFHGKDRRAFIANLYDKLLEVSYLRADPQFWLQYAMARMEDGDWASALKCLETAYTSARARPGYRTYMLDNQMARFYLESAIAGHTTDLDAATSRVVELVNRRMAQMGADIDIYVYRLVQPMIVYRDQLPLSPTSAKAIDRLLRALRDKLAEVRHARRLDEEEARAWQMLSRR